MKVVTVNVPINGIPSGFDCTWFNFEQCVAEVAPVERRRFPHARLPETCKCVTRLAYRPHGSQGAGFTIFGTYREYSSM